MTRLWDSSHGQVAEFERILAAHGMCSEDVAAVLRDPELARKMIEAVRSVSYGDIRELFVSPGSQIANVRRWSQERSWDQSWNFTDSDLAKAWAELLYVEGPNHPFVVLVLVPYLDTVRRTFDELWIVASQQQPHAWRWEQLKSDPEHLRLAPGITHRPGLRWEKIDLAANWDRRPTRGAHPIDVCSQAPAHAGVLAAAAHFPTWVRAMDHERVPCVYLPGYRARVPSISEDWSSVPGLGWSRIYRKIRMSASPLDP